MNFGQWQKNGNVLRFQSANSDSLGFDSDLVLSGDFDISFDLTSNISANSQALASFTSSPKLYLFGGGKIYFQNGYRCTLFECNHSKLPLTGSFVYGDRESWK